MNETGKKVSNVVIVICILVLVGCGIAFLSTEQDYAIDKGNALMDSYIGTATQAENSQDTFNDITSLRTIYIVVMIASFIVLVSSIYVRSSSNKKKAIGNSIEPITNNADKLKELEELKNSNLISEAEFTEKRNDILKNI